MMGQGRSRSCSKQNKNNTEIKMAAVARSPAMASIQERSARFTPKVNASFCMARAPWEATGIPSGEGSTLELPTFL